jgi:hypothetical protein
LRIVWNNPQMQKLAIRCMLQSCHSTSIKDAISNVTTSLLLYYGLQSKSSRLAVQPVRLPLRIAYSSARNGC